MLCLCRSSPVPWPLHLTNPFTTLRRAVTSRCGGTKVQHPLIEAPADYIAPYQKLLEAFRKCEELTEEELPRFTGSEQPTQDDLQVRTHSYVLRDA